MVPTLVFTLATLGVVSTNPRYYPQHYPPTYIPAEAPFGYLYPPIFDVHPLPRLPITYYSPQPGDVLLMSDTNRFWTFLNRLALTGKPGHNGLVVRMPDGRLGVFEAGYNDTRWTRVTPLDYKINMYPGYVWVRPRTTPLTPAQDRLLTAFAMAADGRRYATLRFLTHASPLSPRGPLLTVVFGKPIGSGHRYYCAESTVEALVYAGVIDGRTARPGATFPQDLFYDRSRNRYIDHHPPLGTGGWAAPQLWTPLPGTALRGKTRPQPPAPWPGESGAYLVQPLPIGGKEVPTPVIVGYVAGEPQPLPSVEYPPQRVGFFDRPYRLLRRR